MVAPSKPARRGKRTLLLRLMAIICLVVIMWVNLRLRWSLRKGENELRSSTPWKKTEADKKRNTFGTETPTGTYLYMGTPRCARKAECQLYFPAIDLQEFVEKEELLADPVVASVARLPPPQMGGLVFGPPRYVEDVPMYPDCALLTRTGFKRVGEMDDVVVNQDRALILSPYWVGDTRYSNVVALFDGHGSLGHVVSHYAAMELPRILGARLSQKTKTLLPGARDNAIREALGETFVFIENTMPRVKASGSTGIVILHDGERNKLFVANTGDSLAFVGAHSKDGASEILYQTSPHKPHLPQETERIQKAGGIVHVPPPGGAESSRVVIPVDNTMQIALAMSRSIGDLEASKLGVIPNPTVDVIDLDASKNLFVVVASDGVFDRIDPTVVADRLGASLFKATTTTADNQPKPLEACEQIIMQSSELWRKMGLQYRDDITLGATRL